MIPINDIITYKINSRHKRTQLDKVQTIEDIVNECCSALKSNKPEVLYCDTLVRSFNAFTLRNKSFLIYDNCLAEALFLYNSIINNTFNSSDVNKLFYKIFSEELILKSDLLHSLYFVGKYNQNMFSFDKISDELDKQIRDQTARQIYFLIGHELTHLGLSSGIFTISSEFNKFILTGVHGLSQRFIKNEINGRETLSNLVGYFTNRNIDSFDEYSDTIKDSSRFAHFVEECFCDFTGFKLLMEHYAEHDVSIFAISNAINYLILQESIRSDMANGIEHISDIKKEAQDTLFFSVFRLQILFMILQANKIDASTSIYEKTQNNWEIIDALEQFIQNLPKGDSLKILTPDMLPNIGKEKLEHSLVSQLYYGRIT